jgi:hypothetical protein
MITENDVLTLTQTIIEYRVELDHLQALKKLKKRTWIQDNELISTQARLYLTMAVILEIIVDAEPELSYWLNRVARGPPSS